MLERRLPRGSLLPAQGHRAHGAGAARAAATRCPTLTDFFVARYSRKYNRPARPISDELRQLFLQYDWPGNIRELENMIKRVVILQDEHLVVREIERNMQRTRRGAVAAAAPVAVAVSAAAAVPVGAGVGSSLPRRLRRPRRTRSSTARTTPTRTGRGRRRIAGGRREGRVDEGRARRDRADAAAGALEPPQGRRRSSA